MSSSRPPPLLLSEYNDHLLYLGDGNLIFKLLGGDYPFFGGDLCLVLGLVLLSCQFGGQLASFYMLLDFRLAVMTRNFVGLESTH